MIEATQMQTSAKQTAQLEQLADANTAVLFQTRTVFPFKLFPAEVKVTRSKITVSNSVFFFEKEVRSMLVKEIVRVEVDQAMFLATVDVYDRSPNGVALRITHLWKNDAHQLRHFIEGLMIAQNEGVDVSKVDDKTVVKNVEELGTMTQTESTVDQT